MGTVECKHAEREGESTIQRSYGRHDIVSIDEGAEVSANTSSIPLAASAFHLSILLLTGVAGALKLASLPALLICP